MNRRLRAIIALLSCFMLGSCVMMPNTSALIAPTTADQFWMAVLADIDDWTNFLVLLGI